MNGCDNLRLAGGKCSKHGGGPRCKVDGCDKGSQAGGKCRGHGGYSNVVGSIFKACNKGTVAGQSTSHSTPSGTVTTSLPLKKDQVEPRQDESMKGVFGKSSTLRFFLNSRLGEKSGRLSLGQVHQDSASSSTPPRQVLALETLDVLSGSRKDVMNMKRI